MYHTISTKLLHIVETYASCESTRGLEQTDTGSKSPHMNNSVGEHRRPPPGLFTSLAKISTRLETSRI
jgi:hypothetical protein